MPIGIPNAFIMILNINDNQFIIDLQERFAECFPYLKIEFYEKPSACGKIPPKHQMLPGNLRISDCRRIHDPGLLDIKSYYKTGRVELDFKEIFGLHVQIFRQEANRWTGTCKTKNLTLQQQSEIARHTMHAVPKMEMAEVGDFGYH